VDRLIARGLAAPGARQHFRDLLFGFWIFVSVTMQIVGFEHFPDVSQRLF
jgi:hypothetical protein